MSNLPANWPTAHTSNGVLIVPGLKVRDYNYKITTVTDRKPSMDGGTWVEDDTAPYGHIEGGTPWFDTANGGMFDGSRLLAL